jgi:hypothetical protein
MVRAILRPLFQRAVRGAQSPGGKMFMAGTAPVWLDTLTDPGSALDVDVTETIDTDINVTTNETKKNQNIDPSPNENNTVAKENAELNEATNEESINNTVVSNSSDANKASSTVSETDVSSYIDNDSVKRINNYKDIIRTFLGDASGGDKLQQTALLLQIGTALMSGRTDQPGLRGFFDVVGQAGAQAAPILFQMGIEKQKADREINAAALDLYFKQMEDMSDRSGPYVMVYQNYKTNDDGSLSLDSKGQPIKLEKPLKRMTVKRTSPEEASFYEFNTRLGFDVFSFVEAGEGSDAFGLNYADQVTVNKDQGSDANAQIKYANYVKRGLIPMAETIIPMLIDREDLTGLSGAIGKVAGPLAEVFEEFTGNVIAGEFDSADPTGAGFAVRERSNGSMMMGGVEVPVFIDYDNKYGGNGLNQDRYGNSLADGGYGVDIYGNPARSYIVAGTLEKILQSGGERSVLQTFETTLGLMLARDRQPTGRMLADVLRRSFEDVNTTNWAGRGTDQAVIQNYVRIYEQLYNNMTGALTLAGLDQNTYQGKPDEDNPFIIPGSKNLANSYYNWLQQPENKAEYLRTNIPGVPGGITYQSWIASTKGNIQMNHKEDMDKSTTTVNDIRSKWGLN